jgi:predicted phage-related endonuclease|tara:strand:- start:79 stop:885 length:807 start_codon:yes stop_codon:yes gene_type:complete
MNRIGFIGGSDMRRIMEGDWISLWEEKTGRKKPDDLSDVLPVQLGTFTEDFNIDWFHKQTGMEVFARQKVVKLDVDGVPCKGHLDGVVSWDNAIIECKHTYDNNSIDNVLKQYMPQIQFYMWVGNYTDCYLSVLFGNRRWESVRVSRADDYIERMRVHLRTFWQLVVDDTPPAEADEVYGNHVNLPNQDKIPVNDMVKRDASGDNEFISRCHDYIEQQSNAQLFESAKADLKAMVGDNEREVYCDLLTIKRDKRGSLRIAVKENHYDD